MSALAASLPRVHGLLKPVGEGSRQTVIHQARTRSDRPVHIWYRTDEQIFGAWLGIDGWWRASAWRLDGRMGPFRGPLDLIEGESLPDR